jgi:xanthine dehydrogenase YagT iron-sulfur-binding subunit
MSTNFVSVGPGVGAHAPDLVVRGVEQRPAHGEPRVLAFARGWTPAGEPPELIAAIRAQLRGLGAELLVLSDGGVWSMRADDPVEQLAAPGAQFAADVATAAMLYGVRDGAGAVFVIDGRGVVRFAHRPEQPPRSVCQALADALAIAVAALHDRAMHEPRQRVLCTRREWAVTCLVIGCAATFLRGCKERSRPPAERTAEPAAAAPADVEVTLRINGKARVLTIDPRTSLLDVLRERLGLTGTKKGCDAGQCGACTVLAGGKRITACLTLAVMAQGKHITTIEGLATGGVLHPMQQAFVDHDGLQCGYCTPGQILSAVALLGEGHATTDAEVREQMSGNICRCGAYPNIVAAIQAARRARG